LIKLNLKTLRTDNISTKLTSHGLGSLMQHPKISMIKEEEENKESGDK